MIPHPLVTQNGQPYGELQLSIWAALPPLPYYRRLSANDVESYQQSYIAAIAESPGLFSSHPTAAETLSAHLTHSDWSTNGYVNPAGVVLAAVSVRRNADESLLIANLFRLKVVAGQHLGQMLLRSALEIAIQERREIVRLNVMEQNEHAHSLYTGIGFKPVDPAIVVNDPEQSQQGPGSIRMELVGSAAIQGAIDTLAFMSGQNS